jgi:Uncharacterised protein family (UPF0236)
MQGYQSRVASLLIETELELRQQLRSVKDLDGIEAAARSVADGFARRLVEDLLAGADVVVAKGLPRGWRLVGFRTRNLLSTVGPLRLKRRLYRDAQGRARLPLDEELGLAPQVRATARMQEVAVDLCSRVPFRVAAGVLRKVLPAAPSPVALHRLVAKVGDRRDRETERLRQLVFDQGEPGRGERRVQRLFVEADGKWVHLQQTVGHRDLELYLALSHEGWELEGRQRWRLKEKQVQVEVGGKLRFWEAFSARLAERYDLSDTRVVINGDGADWVQHGPAYFHRAYGQLDRFHLIQALRRVLPGRDWRRAYQATCRGELLPAVRAILQAGHPDGPAVIQYLERNRAGLADYRLREGFTADPALRGLGAGEANIDKVIANRMSKRGMAWTIAGARRMAKVLETTHNGVLGRYVSRPPAAGARRRPLRRFLRSQANAVFRGTTAEEALRTSWSGSRNSLENLLRRIGRPPTLWELH